MKFICIYNANSGLLNGAMDSLHKLVSPNTYQCKLCALTHGYFGANKERKTFLSDFPHEIEFLHKDELQDTKYNGYELPCIIAEQNDGSIAVVVTAQYFRDIHHTRDLIQKLTTVA